MCTIGTIGKNNERFDASRKGRKCGTFLVTIVKARTAAGRGGKCLLQPYVTPDLSYVYEREGRCRRYIVRSGVNVANGAESTIEKNINLHVNIDLIWYV